MRNDFHLKRLCSLLTAASLALSLSATGYAAAGTDEASAKTVSTYTLLSPQTEDDPQYWSEYRKYMDQEEDNSPEEPDTSILLTDTFQYTSPYTGETYTINGSQEDLALGVDVSYYQGEIDWAAAKADGVEFAFIRAAYRGYGQAGTLVTDSQFYNNLASAMDQGIKVGIYIYSQATTVEEAREEAEYVLALIDGYQLDLPIVFDQEFAEASGGYTGRLYNAYTAAEDKVTFLTDLACAFCDTIAENGYTPMVYASENHFNYEMDINRLSNPVWVARYNTSVNLNGTYAFWQYTSGGTVAGIPGKVDCNFSVAPAFLDCSNPSDAGSFSRIIIIPGSYPTGNITAASFSLTGSILSALPLVSVSASLVNASGNVVQTYTDLTTNSEYTIKGSAIDQNLKFASLSSGYYYLTYTATDTSGAETTWQSDVFAVADATLFPDVLDSSAWYYSYAYKAASLGFISGDVVNNSVLFCPNNSLTRAQFVCMLYRVAGSPAIDSSTHPFTDAKSGWYQTALNWAYQQGVVSGTSATTFSPNTPVTREELATMIYQFSNASPATSNPLSGYTDSGQVSSWATTYVNWCIDQGLLSSTSTQTLTFSPKSSATRAQAAVLLSNYIEKFVNP